ncbi:spindle assembly abnormal protein [Anaeramoeba flamelloides]|uniref:Spindle assembly abnormal protein n=1 Tax=Anaeramoeba flamelloides TaxID=1746091 RepID=A0ABQ8XVT0_9EUKA|nr:spindle assembly abnormal protein [Anaeramoeba flamelloides]
MNSEELLKFINSIELFINYFEIQQKEIQNNYLLEQRKNVSLEKTKRKQQQVIDNYRSIEHKNENNITLLFEKQEKFDQIEQENHSLSDSNKKLKQENKKFQNELILANKEIIKLKEIIEELKNEIKEIKIKESMIKKDLINKNEQLQTVLSQKEKFIGDLKKKLIINTNFYTSKLTQERIEFERKLLSLNKK